MRPSTEEVNLESILGMVAHEVRSPLQAIMSSTYLLESCEGNEESVSNCTKVIKRQTKLLENMFNCLYLYTDIKNKGFNVKLRPFSTSDILSTAIETVIPSTRTKGIKINLNEVNKLEIVCIPELLIQTISNLLSNSIKFSPNYSTIKITASGNDAITRFSIKDEGLGLSNSETSRLFDLFHQESEINKDGLGIGLYLAERFIKIHKGRIDVISGGHNMGTDFIITIPSQISGKDEI